MHFTRKHNHQSGFSLIEVFVSMLIIGVMIVLFAAALNVATLSRKLRHENFAYHIANKQMENLRATPYDSLPASGTITDPMISELPSGAGSFTVNDYPGFLNVKQIIVTVGWNDGMAKEIEIKTLSGVGGINP